MMINWRSARLILIKSKLLSLNGRAHRVSALYPDYVIGILVQNRTDPVCSGSLDISSKEKKLLGTPPNMKYAMTWAEAVDPVMFFLSF